MYVLKFVFKSIVLGLFLLGSARTPAQAQARLMAQRAFSSEAAKPLEIKSLRAEANIVDTVASVSLDTVFRNPYNERLEAIYALPLPASAAVTDLALWEDGRPVVGITGTIPNAIADTGFYGSAVRHPLDAELAQTLTPHGFNVRLFPVKPLSEWRITLTYHCVVPFEAGKFRFALPLQTPSAGAAPIASLSARVSLYSRAKIVDAVTAGYIPEVSTAPGQSTFVYEAQSVTSVPLLRLSFNFEPRSSAMATTVHQPGGYDYFVLHLNAPSLFPILPDHVILLLDSSGSMRGEKLGWMQTIARGLTQQLGRTHKKPRLSALTFNSEARRLGLPVEQSIQSLQAGGGSDLQSALWEARRLIRPADRDTAIVVISDGQPTLGSRTLAQLKPALQMGSMGNASAARVLRLYAVDVGDTIQSTLTRELADATGGVTIAARSTDETNTAAALLTTSFGGAAWQDVRVQLAGNRPAELYPKNPASVLAGSSTFVIGRSPGLPRNAVVTLFDTRANSAATLRPELPVASAAQSTLSAAPSQTLVQILPVLWAQQKVNYLTGEMKKLGRSAEVEEQITELSFRHRLINSHTSSWVVETPDNESQSVGVGPPGPAGPPGPMGPPGQPALPPLIAPNF